jgi:hypothetical protein
VNIDEFAALASNVDRRLTRFDREVLAELAAWPADRLPPTLDQLAGQPRWVHDEELYRPYVFESVARLEQCGYLVPRGEIR